MMRKSAFKYERASDGYRCPQGELLTYATTDRSGYRHYTSDPARCRSCPLLGSCTGNAKAERTITRHVWQDARERSDANRLTPWGKLIYKRRKETVERSFADAKQLFGHPTRAFAGWFASLANACWRPPPQNITKIALILAAKTDRAAALRTDRDRTLANRTAPASKTKTPPKNDGVCQRSERARTSGRVFILGLREAPGVWTD